MRSSILKLLKPDIIVEMLEMAFSYGRWDKVMNISDVLYNWAECMYEECQYAKATGKSAPLIETSRPLVYYFGFSHLIRGMACQKQGEYDQAREYVYKYAELGWMEDLGEQGESVAEEFRLMAKANLYALDLLSGQTEVLAEYAAFLQDNPEELLPGMGTILEAALRYKLDVDDLLDRFAEQADAFAEYEDAGNVSYYVDYCRKLALYLIRKGNQKEALEYVMQSLTLADKTDNDMEFKKSLALFEAMREHAAERQERQYRELLAGCL